MLQVRLEGGTPEALVQEFHDLEDPHELQVLRVSRVPGECQSRFSVNVLAFIDVVILGV